ncbi:MAG: rod shape-determining protein MreC [Actinomycetota bacterium]|nr:rod shape-determining protein MreC [Actinomycetota bacterium]MDD5666504.1 rod shape-determining protein MreC [Actinomycetota bacterium]
MVERQNRRQRALIITLVIICILLVTVYSRESKDGLFHRLQRFSLDIVSPLQKGMSKVLSPVKDGIGYLTDLGDAKSERDRLKEEVESLQDVVDELEEMKLENKTLTKMIAVKESRPDLEYLVVDVIGANPDVWEQTIQIGAGYSNGLQEYMAVLSEDGSLIGRITLCTSEVSLVQLITDERSSVGAMLQNNAEMGVVKGEGRGGVRLELLNQDAEVETGDVVVTSGLGGTCPAGIPVGTITEISERRADLSVGIVISPRASLTRLDRVMVVTSPLPRTAPIKAEEGG